MATIFITGATDGIGRAAAELLAPQGHHLLIHGRQPAKLDRVVGDLGQYTTVDGYIADLSSMSETLGMASSVSNNHQTIDVLINNAGIFSSAHTTINLPMDAQFMVNCLAPYALTRELLPLLRTQGRVVNVSSAAQAPLAHDAFQRPLGLADGLAYAQSKTGLMMWTDALARQCGDSGPLFVAVNPGSYLGTKMVKDAFGMDGHDIQIGATILSQLALRGDFIPRNGSYFDNDSKRFRPLDAQFTTSESDRLMAALDHYVTAN